MSLSSKRDGLVHRRLEAGDGFAMAFRPGAAGGINEGRQTIGQIRGDVEDLSTQSRNRGALQERVRRQHGVHGAGLQQVGKLRKRAFDERDLAPVDAFAAKPFARHDVEEAAEAGGADLLANEVLRLFDAGIGARHDAIVGVVHRRDGATRDDDEIEPAIGDLDQGSGAERCNLQRIGLKGRGHRLSARYDPHRRVDAMILEVAVLDRNHRQHEFGHRRHTDRDLGLRRREIDRCEQKDDRGHRRAAKP